MSLDLFTPQVSADRLHPHFKTLTSGIHDPEMAAFLQWAGGFEDRDGKFVHEFQTTFWSSFWEIYLNAAFRELGFSPNYGQATPDFHLLGKSGEVVAEAAVTQEADGYVTERHRETDELFPDADMPALLEYATIRLANTFSSKLTKYREKYAELPHVRGRPFVLCVAPFEQPMSFLQSDRAMRRVLYRYDMPVWIDHPEEGTRTILGSTEVRAVEKDTGAEVDLGYFRSEVAPEVSAVIFSTVATLGKLRAVAPECSHRVLFSAVRYQADALHPRIIKAEKSDYVETLLDGLHLFLNPYATHPLDPSAFEGREVTVHYGYDAEEDFVVTDGPDDFLISRTSVGFNTGPVSANPQAPVAEADRRTPGSKKWPEGELRQLPGGVGTFEDHHLAHYRDWTILVVRDTIDADWSAMVRPGTYRDVSPFIEANIKDGLGVPCGDWCESKEAARQAGISLVDRLVDT